MEMLGTNRKSCKVAVTVEPDKPPVGNCDQAELGEFALSVSGKDGCAIYGVELESIDQHVTFVNSSADAKKLKTATCQGVDEGLRPIPPPQPTSGSHYGTYLGGSL